MIIARNSKLVFSILFRSQEISYAYNIIIQFGATMNEMQYISTRFLSSKRTTKVHVDEL